MRWICTSKLFAVYGIVAALPFIVRVGHAAGSTARAISAGGDTCALTTAGGVKCWGFNDFGEVGNGTRTHQLTPVDVSGLTSDISAVSAGTALTCGLSMP